MNSINFDKNLATMVVILNFSNFQEFCKQQEIKVLLTSLVSFDLVPIRLVDGPDDKSGRVEIYLKGEWGTVCDEWFGKEEAQVICKSLGYP